MTSRRKEFSKAIKVARLKHATKGGVIFCEGCGAQVKPGHFAFDHDDPDGLMGEPTFDNCKMLCLACHALKTSLDVAAIARAKRIQAKHVGVKQASSPIAQRPKQERAARFDRTPLPPRSLYEKAK